jgi:hypothetical protein
MVDSINSSAPISTLLRAQTAGLSTLNNSRQPAQTLINQLTNGARPTTVQPSAKGAGTSKGNLPRGSLVDIVA